MYAKSFRQTFYVILLSLVAAYAGNIIDSIIVGRFYGSVAIAAIGLADPFIGLIETFGAGISAGIQTVCGSHLGSGRIKTANAHLLSSFIIAAVISIIIVGAIQLNPHAFVDLLISSDVAPEMSDALLDYVKGYSLGVPFIILVTILIPIMQMDSDNSKGYISILILAITNIVADLFVVFFIEDATLFEIAVATDLAYVLDAIFLFTHFFKKNNLFKLGWYKQKLKYFKNIGINSLPAVLNRLSTTLRNWNINRAVFFHGKELGVVANSVQGSFGGMLSSFPKAFGQSTLLTCSVIGSEKSSKSVKKAFKTGLLNGVLITFEVSVIFCLLSQFIIMMYIDVDNYAFEESKNAFIMYCMSLPIYAINAMFINFYQSIGKIKYSALLNILDNFFFIATLTWMLPFRFGITGAWLANIFGKVCTTIFMYIVACVVNKKPVFNLENLMLLPQSFYNHASKLSFFDIRTLQDSAVVSHKIKNFCEKRGVSKNKALWSSLAVEELLNNTIKHGLEKNQNTIEVMVSVDAGHTHILIKDNCRRFDPIEWSELTDENDKFKSIGIKMVRESAKSFKYERLINLNYLQIDY